MIGAQGYLTEGGHIPAEIRRELEDFVVEELPILFPGNETCALIEKRGISTNAAMRKIGKALGIPSRKITYAGLKDARAITRQWVSAKVPESSLKGVDLGNVRVIKTQQGSVRFGQLEGNHFSIRIRCDAKHETQIRSTLKELSKRGVPNFFGWQRFGSRRPNTHLVGRAAIARDFKRALDLYVGSPYKTEHPILQEARRLYDDGKLRESMQTFPKKFVFEKNMVHALLKGKTHLQAYRTLPEKMQMLMVGAAQAEVFNQIISWRLPKIDELWKGDIAKSPLRVFTVRDPTQWGEQLESFEVSPTAAFGSCRYAENEQGDLEKKLASALPMGHRREMRFKVQDINVLVDDGIVVEFSIPKGCYATAVIRELVK